MAKKQEVAAQAQTDPTLSPFFTDEPIPETPVDEEYEEEKEEEPTGDEQEDGEEQSAEEEHAKQKDKFDGKSREEIIEAYRNLEALQGRQAQELGERRKQETTTETKEYNMTNLGEWPDSVLEKQIANYEEYLATPDQAINDSEHFGLFNAQHNRMVAEQAKRAALSVINSKQVKEDNSKVLSEHPAKQYLTQAELEQASQFAISKLADDGKLTASDLDVAVHKLFPDKWVQLTVDKERVRMTTVQTKRTPMLSTSGNQPRTTGLKTPEEAAKMSEEAYEQYLDSLSYDQLTQLKAKINKRG